MQIQPLHAAGLIIHSEQKYVAAEEFQGMPPLAFFQDGK